MQKSRYEPPLRKLRQAREDLSQEYTRIRHDLVRLDKMIAQLEAMNAGTTAGPSPAPAPPLQDIAPGDLDGLSHAQAATVILARTAAPLTIRQILAVFERAGRKLSARNGYGILHKSLRNHKEFDSVAGKWRLVATPYPARVDDLHVGRQERAG